MNKRSAESRALVLCRLKRQWVLIESTVGFTNRHAQGRKCDRSALVSQSDSSCCWCCSARSTTLSGGATGEGKTELVGLVFMSRLRSHSGSRNQRADRTSRAVRSLTNPDKTEHGTDCWSLSLQESNFSKVAPTARLISGSHEVRPVAQCNNRFSGVHAVTSWVLHNSASTRRSTSRTAPQRWNTASSLSSFPAQKRSSCNKRRAATLTSEK